MLPFFSLFLISQVRLSLRSLHLQPATNHDLRTSRERTSAQRMSSSDENEFEAQTYVSVETHVVPSPPPLPPLLEEERDRSGSSASSSSSSSASSRAPASSHSDDDRQEEAEVRVVKEVVTVTEWQQEENRVEVVSVETTWETRSAEAQVEHTDAGRMSRRSSSSSSSSASSGKGRVVKSHGLAEGPKITLFVKVGDTLHVFTSWTHRSQT